MISTLALSSQHSRCIETHTKVHPITSLTLIVAGSGRRGAWTSTNYMRPLGKRSLFWQHLVSTIPAWQAIVLCILDGEYCVYGGLEAKASMMLLFMHGGVTVRDFIVIRWINNEFGSDLVPIHLIGSICIQFTSPQTEFKYERNHCALNAHWIRF